MRYRQVASRTSSHLLSGVNPRLSLVISGSRPWLLHWCWPLDADPRATDGLGQLRRAASYPKHSSIAAGSTNIGAHSGAPVVAAFSPYWMPWSSRSPVSRCSARPGASLAAFRWLRAAECIKTSADVTLPARHCRRFLMSTCHWRITDVLSIPPSPKIVCREWEHVILYSVCNKNFAISRVAW